MRFINPKTDFAFKKIFGSIESKPILISFLNALLYVEPLITDLEILDPYLAPKLKELKETIVDVRALLNNGQHVIIEMQVLNLPGFEKRILYNTAKTYSTQIKAGEDYTKLNGVIALTITDFDMFPEWPGVQSVFLLKERDRLTTYAEGNFELVFVELPKFTKKLEELTSVRDKWLYFLKEAKDLTMVPGELGGVKEINEAFNIANRAKLTDDELEAEEKRAMWLFDQKTMLERVAEKARKDALAEGEQMERCKVVKRLLDTFPPEEVARLMGLSLPEVEAASRYRR